LQLRKLLLYHIRVDVKLQFQGAKNITTSNPNILQQKKLTEAQEGRPAVKILLKEVLPPFRITCSRLFQK
jgi:hypothetical protein